MIQSSCITKRNQPIQTYDDCIGAFGNLVSSNLRQNECGEIDNSNKKELSVSQYSIHVLYINKITSLKEK